MLLGLSQTLYPLIWHLVLGQSPRTQPSDSEPDQRALGLRRPSKIRGDGSLIQDNWWLVCAVYGRFLATCWAKRVAYVWRIQDSPDRDPTPEFGDENLSFLLKTAWKCKKLKGEGCVSLSQWCGSCTSHPSGISTPRCVWQYTITATGILPV